MLPRCREPKAPVTACDLVERSVSGLEAVQDARRMLAHRGGTAGMSGDEAIYTMIKMLRELPKDVFSVWSEQYGEVERMTPEYGSYAAALDAYEAAHPDAA